VNEILQTSDFADGSHCGWFGLRRRRILFQAGEASLQI
jgi:hypothetical protein